MTIQNQLNRTLFLLLAALCILGSYSTPLQAQILLQGALGDIKAPVMSLYVLRLDPGQTGTPHSHDRAIFAYILEGEVENQIERDPLKTLHVGDFFDERPNQVHRVFRNLSTTKPARILMFQNRPMLPPEGTLPPGVESKSRLQEPLGDVPSPEVSLTKITTAPGATSAGAHQHPGPVFAYLLKGEVESQVDPDPPKTYRAGDVFYEPAMHAHRLYRNLSTTEPAELLVFQIREKGKPFSVRVDK
jgi:quercetin dioxygenase-like cupin family protein